MGKIIESACEYGIQLANDNSHGYDQINRWLPDVDCSSLVVLCYEHAGIPVKAAGATYTGNLKAGFTKCGFTAIPCKKMMPGLKRGDIVFYHYVESGKTHGHAILYIGDGKIVQASINERGKAIGGESGDQTGKEVSIGNFYIPTHGWDYILRLNEDNMYKEEDTVDISLSVLKKGSKCPEVKSLQILLYSNGFNCGTADGDFGPKTDAALRNYQRKTNLTVDGICGKNTWTQILTK